jgi:hypothetical protein
MATPFSAAIVADRLRDLELVKTNLQKIKNCSILCTHTDPYHFFEHLVWLAKMLSEVPLA